MIIDTEKLRDDAAYREELRHRCLTDHFFLADLMRLNLFVKSIHQPVVDLYFPKNPNLTIEEQSAIKFRMHLDPRGTYKTTMGRVDSLQWILAFPELITILNETATQPLARAVSQAIARYLYQPKGRPATTLQLLFPELVTDKEPTFSAGTWNTMTKDFFEVDSTLSYTSPESVQSGWHPWVECIDDMVETKNSGINASSDVRQAVIDTYYTNKNTLRRGGYINIRGTRYHPFDLYGDIIDKMDPQEWKVLIRSAITVRNGLRLVNGEFPEENDVTLNFSELPGMDYRALRQIFFDNYESFMCQQMNDPQGGAIQKFPPELFHAMEIAPERIPQIGETFVCWRLPYGGKDSMANYAEGAAGRIWDGKVYIVDAWQGKYVPSKLAEKVVREAKKWQTNHVMMEDVPGTQYMEAHIKNEAIKKNWSLRIQWLEFEEDDTQRISRLDCLEPQARAGRIWISTATGKQAELRRQFINYGLVVENGIIDCISRIAGKVPLSLMRQEIDDEEEELQIRRRHDLQWQHIYGQMGGMEEVETQATQEEMAHAKAMERVNNLGLTDILGGLDG